MKQIVMGLLALTLVISGCGRIVDWSKKTFNQGTLIPLTVHEVDAYVRSASVYELFTTQGLFDVLWLSEPVRRIYLDLLVSKHGKPAAEREAMWLEQRKEMERFISFYIVGYIPQTHGVNIDDVASPWAVQLHINGSIYHPVSSTVVDLNPEYIFLLRKIWSRFKTVYLVTFDAHDRVGNQLMQPTTNSMELMLRTEDRWTAVRWDLEQGTIKREGALS
jgi:hypothetical protein